MGPLPGSLRRIGDNRVICRPMASGTEVEHTDSDDISEDDQVELTPTQLGALEKLEEMGEAPALYDEKAGKMAYSSDAQIRALQLMAEGRLGGPGRGQGRRPKERASDKLARLIDGKVKKMDSALDRALDSENDKIAMDAVRLAVDIQDKSVNRQIAEEKHEAELESMGKGDLVDTLFTLFADPLVEAALAGPRESKAEEDGQAILTLPASSVTEVTQGDDSESATSVRDHDSRTGRSSKRGAPKRDHPKGGNPWTEAARRRAAN